MSYSILTTHRFEKEIKRLVKKFPSLKGEFATLINELSNNPQLGTFIYRQQLLQNSLGD